MSFEHLRESLIQDEGVRFKPYRDTQGKLTIGVGRNLDDVGLSYEEVMFLLRNDIDRVVQEASERFPWFNSLSVPRQDVVLNMVFNLGMKKFLCFQNMIEALRVQNYEKAADEMLRSLWAIQVKGRARRLAHTMRTGIHASLGSV